MKVLIYAGHPAQYMFFRSTIIQLRSLNHDVLLLIKSKDVLEQIVEEDGLEYQNILKEGRKNNRISIAFGLFKREFRLLNLCRKFKPDLLLGSDPSLAHIGFIKRIPCITCLEDDISVIPELARLTFPFTKYIFAPEVCDVGRYSKKKIGYNGNMKLAYLHPSQFVPNYKLVNSKLLSSRFIIIRLSSLNAYHDNNAKGISIEFLAEIIKKLENYGKVFISSESVLPENFVKYLLDINPALIHHYMSFADLLISDSQSMSVESAVLGIPSIRISTFVGRISVLEEIEHKYLLSFGYTPEHHQDILNRIDGVLDSSNKIKWKERHLRFLKEKIDVSDLLLKLILGYPNSVHQLTKL